MTSVSQTTKIIILIIIAEKISASQYVNKFQTSSGRLICSRCNNNNYNNKPANRTSAPAAKQWMPEDSMVCDAEGVAPGTSVIIR